MTFSRFILLALLPLLMAVNNGDVYLFASDYQAQQFNEITQQLRCPKCQNNNIAESAAPIATDMRLKVYQLLQAGYNQQQIMDYMINRYGYFISYQPPITPITLILWLAPAGLLFVGILLPILLKRYGRLTKRDAFFSSKTK